MPDPRPSLRSRLAEPVEEPEPRVATAAEVLANDPNSAVPSSPPSPPASPPAPPTAAVAVAGSALPAQTEPAGGAGLTGKFDETDWIIPSLLIVQPTSQLGDMAPVGALAMRDGRFWPELRVVLLSIAATRTYFPRDATESLRPYCSSVDRIVGRPFEGFEPYPGRDDAGEYLCEHCPHANDEPWELEEGCYRGYAVLMALVENEDELVIMRIKGTSVSPFKQKVLSLFRPRPRSMKVPDTWDYQFTLTTETVEEPGRKFCRLVPVMLGFNPDKEVYGDLARSIAPQLPTAWADEEVLGVEPDDNLPFA